MFGIELYPTFFLYPRQCHCNSVKADAVREKRAAGTDKNANLNRKLKAAKHKKRRKKTNSTPGNLGNMMFTRYKGRTSELSFKIKGKTNNI